MQSVNKQIDGLVSRIIRYGVFPCVKVEGDLAYTVDPVYGIARNRVNAEFAKALMRITDSTNTQGFLNFTESANSGESANSKYSANLSYSASISYTELADKLLNWLLGTQNSDGSWNEVHVKYNQPSALITSIVGEAMVDGFTAFEKDKFSGAARQARDFVLENQISPGYFKKSSLYMADHLNVDATCGAFLSKYGKAFSDSECLDTARVTAEHICKHQFADGAFPYTSEKKGSYQYCLDIPCIHYQGVTLYYLLKILESLESDWLDREFEKGIKWLVSVQAQNGKFDWSKSGLMFAYYLSGAYAFAVPCFAYGTKWDPAYSQNAEKALKVLESNVGDIANRWESDSMLSFPASAFKAFQTANIGDYPISHRLFRFGYGMYRQFARRRFSSDVNPRTFNLLAGVMGIKSSTIEPDNNFPDLFMTSEVLDCLSYVLKSGGGV